VIVVIPGRPSGATVQEMQPFNERGCHIVGHHLSLGVEGVEHGGEHKKHCLHLDHHGKVKHEGNPWPPVPSPEPIWWFSA